MDQAPQKSNLLELFKKTKRPGLNGQWFSNLKALSKWEQMGFCALILGVISLIAYDLHGDILSNQSVTHLAIDSIFGLTATISLLVTWRQMGRTRLMHLQMIDQVIDEARDNVSDALTEAARWKFEAEAIQKGIADEIERQLAEWSLTPSEKEVAFFLLKGLSLKEISNIRGTAERTVRHHTLAIYAKAGVTGRAELSAFFLEEFLDRQNPLTVLRPAKAKATSITPGLAR